MPDSNPSISKILSVAVYIVNSIFYFSRIISLPALIFIVIAALAFNLGRFFGFRMDDLHLVFFLPVLLACTILIKDRRFRLPRSAVLLSAGFWLVCVAYVEGMLTNTHRHSRAYISRLDGDTSGLEARALHRRLNEIARTYQLPRSDLLPRSFNDNQEAQHWLESEALSPFVVRGRADWFDLVFAKDAKRYLPPQLISNNLASLSSSESDRLSRNALENNRQILIVRPPGLNLVLAVTYQPSSLVIPAQPSELTRHWLAWLNAGLSEDSLGEGDRNDAVVLAAREDGLNEASLIAGPWGSHAPLGLTNYLLGTMRLLIGIDYFRPDNPELEDVLQKLRVAAGKVRADESPELFSAIFNNAAVAGILAAEDEKDWSRVATWLELAIDGANSQAPTIGARAAMHNLSALQSAGLVTNSAR